VEAGIQNARRISTPLKTARNPKLAGMPGKIMENRGNHEIILPQGAQRAHKLTDHGKPGKPTDHANLESKKQARLIHWSKNPVTP
jgi:hypothetical protein